MEKVVVEVQVATAARRPKTAESSKESSLWVGGDKREGKGTNVERWKNLSSAESVIIRDLFIYHIIYKSPS